MAMRRELLFVLAAVFPSLGAAYRTTNFLVDAPTPQLAQQFGQTAEYWRREKAIDWLGQEMPPWREPCPLKVRVTMEGAGGATQFSFDRGQVLGQNMNIEGSLDRLLVSVLPHEVTHTVFAYYFHCPVPRWADEGGAVFSEDDIERNRHDLLCRQILNTPRRHIPLRRLFALRDYPGDVMALYAEGFSVTQFLVSASNRRTFLGFVATGMQRGWDGAVQAYYHYNSVDELEQAWLAQLRATRRQPAQLARNTTAPAPAAPRVMVYQTVPPASALPAAPTPIIRGQSAGAEQEGESFGNASHLTAGTRPGYLPDFDPGSRVPGESHENPPQPVSPDGWQPAMSQPDRPPTVILGRPQPVVPAPTAIAHPTAAPVSPVGYPY